MYLMVVDYRAHFCASVGGDAPRTPCEGSFPLSECSSASECLSWVLAYSVVRVSCSEKNCSSTARASSLVVVLARRRRCRGASIGEPCQHVRELSTSRKSASTGTPLFLDGQRLGRPKDDVVTPLEVHRVGGVDEIARESGRSQLVPMVWDTLARPPAYSVTSSSTAPPGGDIALDPEESFTWYHRQTCRCT
jgi:hypothetical protein